MTAVSRTYTRDESEPNADLVRHYGEGYADAYRAAFAELPADASSAPRDRVRGQVAHWAALAVAVERYAYMRGETLAELARSYAMHQRAGCAGNSHAATAYAEQLA